MHAGEVILITTSALHTPQKWDGFMERAREEAVGPALTIRKFDGAEVGTVSMGDPNNPSLPIYRSKLHHVLYEHASQLGIPIEFSATGVEYFETESSGGVVLADGRRLTADIVVAADGIGSKSGMFVVGKREVPISSGFVLYRVTFPAEPAMDNPVLAKEFQGYKNRSMLHAGPGAHMVTSKSKNEICWLLTCKVSLTD